MPSLSRDANSFLTALAASALLALPIVAAAQGIDEWDWPSEFQNRTWRTASLNWASDIHPNHPSTQTIQSTVAPPPREQWCYAEPDPTSADCGELDYRLRNWIANYLNIYPQQVTYAQMASFPNECSSICAY